MTGKFRDLLSILTPRERGRFYLLLGLAAVTALFKAVSIAAILPLLTVLPDPGIIDKNAVLARV